MNYLPLNLRKSYPENRVTLTKTLSTNVVGKARVIYLPQGIFFGDDVEITHNNNPLIEGTDYILSGYSKHLKHIYNLDGYGLIVIPNSALTNDVEITVTYLGDGYTVFDPRDIPEYVPLVGAGVEQILWDNIVIGPNIDSRALNGIYPPSKQIGIEGVISLLNLLADQAIKDGPVSDRQTVRDIINSNTSDVLEKIPSGLTTENQTVVGAINELRVLTDTLQLNTPLISIIYNDIDLTGYTNTIRVGWAIGGNVTITGAFDFGDSSVVLSSGDVVIYDPDTGTLFTNQKSVDLLSSPAFDTNRPAGTCAQPLDNKPVESWNDVAFKLILNWFSYAGTLSTIRGNTIVPNNTTEETYLYYVVGEDNLTVTYPTGLTQGPTTITENLSLGDLIYLPYGSPTRILKGYQLPWAPQFENGELITLGITNTKANAENIKSRHLGEIFETLGTSSNSNYLPLDGRAISRTEYSELFSLCGTTFGNGDGVTTFNIPSSYPLSTPSQFETTVKRCNITGVQYNLTLTNNDKYGLVWGASGTIKRIALTDGTLVDTGLTGIPVYVPAWNETLIYNSLSQLIVLNVETLTTTLKGTYGGQTINHLAVYGNRLFAFGSHIVEFSQSGDRNVLSTYPIVTRVSGVFTNSIGDTLFFIDGNLGKSLNTLTGTVVDYPSLDCQDQGFIGDKGNDTAIIYDSGLGTIKLIDTTDMSESTWGKFIPNLYSFTISPTKPDIIWGWVNHHLFNRYQLPMPNQYIVAKKEQN